MATDSGFIEHLRELLEPIPGVTFKRMFGGHGVFRGGLMFGLIVEETLYFKTDAQNRADFEERSLEPFIYMKAGKPMPMSYYRAPDEALDDSDEMVAWAEKAYAAALRAQVVKPKAKKSATAKR